MLTSRLITTINYADISAIVSDGHDKPFCTKAITIIVDFKKALGDTGNRQISIS